MSYQGREDSVNQGSPFYLYMFNDGLTTTRYTNLSQEVNWDSEVWTPFPIEHTSIKQSEQLSKNSISISMALTGTFVDQFIGWSPERLISVTVFRGHIDEPEVVVYWKGRVSTNKLSTNKLTLVCDSLFTSLRRSGANSRMQRQCRHTLYGKGCNLDPVNFQVLGTLTAINGTTLIVTNADSVPDNWFAGGYITFPDGSSRKIISHSGTTIVINYSSKYLTETDIGAGVSVTLYPGCNKTINICIVKFGNLANQGGFKWIPRKNPMGGDSIV